MYKVELIKKIRNSTSELLEFHSKIVYSPEVMETKNKHLTTKRRAWWLVALMAASYGIGELSHFVLGSTTRHMSRELQYGDQSCMFNGTDSRTIVCVEYKNEST